jgi:hypothetical protein
MWICGSATTWSMSVGWYLSHRSAVRRCDMAAGPGQGWPVAGERQGCVRWGRGLAGAGRRVGGAAAGAGARGGRAGGPPRRGRCHSVAPPWRPLPAQRARGRGARAARAPPAPATPAAGAAARPRLLSRAIPPPPPPPNPPRTAGGRGALAGEGEQRRGRRRPTGPWAGRGGGGFPVSGAVAVLTACVEIPVPKVRVRRGLPRHVLLKTTPSCDKSLRTCPHTKRRPHTRDLGANALLPVRMGPRAEPGGE